MDCDRTTFKIVQGCLLTIYLCTWATIHPQIPRTKRPVRNALEKLFFSVAVIIIPEIMLSYAFMDWFQARESIRLVRKWADDCRGESHCIAKLHIFSQESNAERNPSLRHEFDFVDQWTMTHAMFLDRQGFRFVIDGKLQSRNSDEPMGTWQLPKASIVLYFAQCGIVSLPDLKEAIDDRSNADGLSKAIVCIQAIWFLVKCVARVHSHLPITELEVSTVAFIIICVTCYIFWWNMPLDVRTHIDIHITSAQANEVEKWNTDESALPRQSFYPKNFDPWIRIMLSLFGVIFGSLHCLAWDIHFPTWIEQLLWRISAICIAVIPPIGTLFYHQLTEHSAAQSLWPFARFFFSRDSHYYKSYHTMKLGWKQYLDAVSTIVMSLLAILYVAARLTLIVEAFTCLRSMPDGVHEGVNWTTYIPHL